MGGRGCRWRLARGTEMGEATVARGRATVRRAHLGGGAEARPDQATFGPGCRNGSDRRCRGKALCPRTRGDRQCRPRRPIWERHRVTQLLSGGSPSSALFHFQKFLRIYFCTRKIDTNGGKLLRKFMKVENESWNTFHH
jgi:hypothetical protein